MINLINNYSNKLALKMIMPMVFCFGIWVAASIFILKNNKINIPSILSVILLTIQLVSSINDICNKLIPLKLMLVSFISGLFILIIFKDTLRIINYLSGGLAAFFIMILLISISKGQIGRGDLILMTLTGFFLGAAAFFSILFLAIIFAGVCSLILIAMKEGSRKTEIPFAPFVLLGTVIFTISHMG